MNNRVVITGCGVVSPVGIGLQEVFDAIGSGLPGCGVISNFDTSPFPGRFGGEVKAPDLANPFPSHVDRKERFLDRALRQVSACPSFLRAPHPDRYLYIGAGLDYFDLPGFTENREPDKKGWQDHSMNTVAMARSLAEIYGIAGEVIVNVTACVASSQSLGLAFRTLMGGDDGKLVVAGGVDSMLNPLHYMGFFKLGALSSWPGRGEEACRPFDLRRCGVVLGEGAALFVVERLADADPSLVMAELAGYASTMDAYMVTDPAPSGSALADAARRALTEAGMEAEEIDTVHLHGTGTIKNELAETAALKRLFPGRYRDIPVYSMKGQTGHLIAACGAMEMLGVLYSLATQSVPPTVNYSDPDSDVPLRVVSGNPEPMGIRNILKLNSAFGGQNTALVVKKYEP